MFGQRVILILLLIFAAMSQRAAAAVIAGIVRDAETQEKIPEVNISIPAESLSTSTQDDGTFVLAVDGTGTYRVRVTHIGYEDFVTAVEIGSGEINLDIHLPPREHLFDEVVVTATRTPYLLKNVPVTTDVIRAEEARYAGAITVDEALETMTGVNIDEGFSGSGISLRGLDPTRVLVLLDGERMIGRVDGAIDVSQISLSTVEKIEVVKGASSTLYGSDAIGGVVNIITRNPGTREQQLELVSDYGTYNSFLQILKAQTRLNGWGILVGGRFDRTDGFDLLPETPHTNGLENTDKFNVDAKVTRQLSPEWQTEFSGGLFVENKTWLESESRPPRVYVFDDEENNYRYSGRAKVRFNPNPETFVDASIYATYYDHLWEKFSGSSLVDRSRTEDGLFEASVVASHTYTPGHVITMGGDWDLQYLRANSVANGKQQIRSGDFYATYEWKPLEELSILPGIRYEATDTYGDQVNASINVMATPHPRLRLRASHSGGFRAPSIKEVYFRFDHSAAGYLVKGGGPSLQPETSRNTALTLEYSYEGIALHRLTYFYNHLENLIEFDLVDQSETYWRGIYQYRNVFKAYTTGLEWQSRVQLLTGMNFALAYTLMTAKNRQTGAWLLGRSKHAVSISVSQEFSRLGLTAAIWGNWYSKKLWTPRGAQNDFDSDTWAPSQQEINVSLTKRILEQWEAFVRAENITDDVEPEFGYWPGRTINIGMRFSTE